MAIEDALRQEDTEQEVDRLTDDEEYDLKIMVTLAKNLIDEGGFEVITAAEKSSDPGQVIGQFLMQLVAQMSESLPDEVKPSPRIFLGEGGWVEQISDYLQDEYDISSDIMDRAEIYIGTASQAIAEGQQQPGGPAGPQAQQQQAAPVMPQQQGAM